MFVIVDMSDEQKRIFEKYRHHDIKLRRFDVKGCAPFFVAHCHKKYADINELSKIIGRYGSGLFPRNCEIPRELTHLVFTPGVLPLKMLVKTVGEYLCRCRKGCNLSVTVVDKYAKACDVLHTLVKGARYVNVITSRADRYRLCVSDIFTSYGISVSLSDDIASSYGSDVIVSLDDKGFETVEDGRVICYRKFSENRNIFTLNKSKLSYKSFDSEQFDIDKFVFYCALYETCGYQLLEIPAFDDINALNGVL